MWKIPRRFLADLTLYVLGLLLSVSVQAGSSFERGLLWKIERSGAPPSYLFGTMHSDHPKVLDRNLHLHLFF